jgi:hypothetical protein
LTKKHVKGRKAPSLTFQKRMTSMSQTAPPQVARSISPPSSGTIRIDYDNPPGAPRKPRRPPPSSSAAIPPRRLDFDDDDEEQNPRQLRFGDDGND